MQTLDLVREVAGNVACAIANGVPPAMAIGSGGAYWDGTMETQRFDKNEETHLLC